MVRLLTQLQQTIAHIYQKCLRYPALILLVVFGFVSAALYYAQQFSYDASADTLVAENDLELKYFREISEHFAGGDFLFLTYSPKSGELLSRPVLNNLEKLVHKVKELEGVSSVVSLFDAPLIKSPEVPLTKLATDYRTLKSSDVDFQLAHKELTNSPIFKNLLISEDGKTTLIQINLSVDEKLRNLWKKRNALRLIENPSSEQKTELAKLEKDYRVGYIKNSDTLEALLTKIRTLRDEVQPEAISHLGGVPMIASDMIQYAKKDIITFGFSSMALIMVMLFFFFRRLRWVLVPIATTAISILLLVGLLGFLNQPVTIISSNFVSLLAIISISFSVHLVARYRELVREYPKKSHKDLVYAAMADKLKPCVYTALTTMVAFGSLTTSDIIPVIDFGRIMCIGVFIAFVTTYTFFPSILLLMSKGNPSQTIHKKSTLTGFMGYLATQKTELVIILALTTTAVSIVGINNLSLNSRFVDYFKSSTEIHKSLVTIDTELGGTIPMDIILKFPPFEQEEDDSFFGFADEDAFPERYWFTPDKIAYLSKFHDYFATRPEVGKVLSISTLEQVGREFNDGEALNGVELIAVLSLIPESIRKTFIDPYASPQNGLMRISTRIHETGPSYSRDQLISDIEKFGTEELGLNPKEFRVTGMNVLFNSMLKKLFDSQTSTLLFVIGATFVMFLILLQSIRLALIGLLPNILSALTILAFMGFVGIPLDVMTITIAAIIIGIGVDDAIHYLYHFRQAYLKDKDIKTAVLHSHDNIGNALYFTSITVVIGFSVLSFSNFIPTVYFGILTACAMILALLANLIVLPALLVRFYR